MTSTTPDKSYCMKCDILIHTPSGIEYTGSPEEDKFIGVPSVLLNEARKNLAATLGSDALLLTWKDGKAVRMGKVPYRAITGLDTGERRQSEVASLESAAGAALGAGLAFGALSLVEQALTHVKTLKVKTEAKEYEIWVSEAAKWVQRIGKRIGWPEPVIPTAIARLGVEDRRVMTLCPRCGEPIPRAALRCGSCGESMDEMDLASQPTIQELIDTGKIAGIRKEARVPARPSPPMGATSPAMIPQRKFCRECGAKVPRDSMYCEECGSRLVS